jgi:hypothetical protein
MGHKGVSKRKPKKSNSSINVNTTSNTRVGEIPSVQALIKDKDALINRGGATPSASSNKKGKKGK